MAYLAIRTAGAVNGVSALHGDVSRNLFQPLFPRWPVSEVPIGHVTNGVHAPTWDSGEADALWTQTCGKDRWRGDLSGLEDGIRKASDQQLWDMRCVNRRALCDEVRRQYLRQRVEDGDIHTVQEEALGIFDPNALTLGFARRFATYKRPALLLHDPERLVRILTNANRPVQLVLAGKAHPQDDEGQELIRLWNNFSRRPELRSRLIFLRDYNMRQAECLTQGVDVWINTPRRPWEASGTSGMKILVNGGLNLSERDGWWAEAYAPEVGWAIGDGREHGDDPALDAVEANALYTLLEQEIVPQFYDRNDDGIPVRWIERVRDSMARLTPRFSANRTVREYAETFYLPAAAAYEARIEALSDASISIADWNRELSVLWPRIHFGEAHVEESGGCLSFSVEVYLGALSPDKIKVELYADGKTGHPADVVAMRRQGEASSSSGYYRYAAEISPDREASDFTPRLIPHHPLVSTPLERPDIIWQR